MFVGLWIRRRYVSKISKKVIAFFRLPILLCFFINNNNNNDNNNNNNNQ